MQDLMHVPCLLMLNLSAFNGVPLNRSDLTSTLVCFRARKQISFEPCIHFRLTRNLYLCMEQDILLPAACMPVYRRCSVQIRIGHYFSYAVIKLTITQTVRESSICSLFLSFFFFFCYNEMQKKKKLFAFSTVDNLTWVL